VGFNKRKMEDRRRKATVHFVFCRTNSGSLAMLTA
jgi:hypothetical protein